ncbi:MULTISPECIES: GGDEF domain-containing protein [unclassified Sulfurospirillum]|uniref:GGDEF domain-containing protein n=1 Tax=unclassified Sulfurospirillum TaxID=2618290 RepID=UPI0025F98985|nr:MULTISPECIES: GGDEF domain-containing protein [unclassified Sulfurospirillum]
MDAFIYIKDVQYRYAYANKRACEHLGVSLEEIIGQNDALFFDAKTTQMIHKIDDEMIHFGHKVTSEDVFVLKDHTESITCISTKIPLYNEEGVLYGLCGISTDITERKKSEELIKELAYHDSLTHLPNRRMFQEAFAVMIAHAKRMKKHGALLVLDLDNFKPLNDTHGHNAGDLLLIEVAKRLRACVREVDFVARFGGDEFLVALRDLDEEESVAKAEALKIAGKIRLHVNAPYVLDLEEDSKIITHECSASIGVALFNHQTPSKERVFSEADKAMYLAKQKGRNRIEFYEELG